LKRDSVDRVFTWEI